MTEDPGIVARLRGAGCVFAEDEAQLLVSAADTAEELDEMVERRASGLPLEQVVGWAEFRGLRIYTDPGVFVPRRRSEFLAGTAIELDTAASPLIVDLCCGTGALGLAVAAGLTGTGSTRAELAGTEPHAAGSYATGPYAAELHAADIDPDAVACARRNVEPAGGHVYAGDLFAPLPARLRGRVTTLLCNAPYVPTGEIHLLPAEAREYEHRVALDGGDDGLAVLRRAASGAPGWLAPGGHLLTETSDRQAQAMASVMAAAGLEPGVHACADYGSAVVTGRRQG